MILRRFWLGLWLLAGACTPAESPAPGEPADVGKADDTSASRAAFFDRDQMYFVRIDRWDPARMTPASLADDTTVLGAELRIYRSAPTSSRHCPDAEVGPEDLVHRTQDFEIRTSGNFTKGLPKSSYKIGFTKKGARLLGMKDVNLKSMWNDVSQMREALAWTLFARAGVAAPRFTWAKFCINDRYYGLYIVIEQVDDEFAADRWQKNDEGNLYKAYWADVGPADLTHRRSSTGDDSGRQYWKQPDIDDRTYQLKTNEDDDDDPALQTYDDLAELVRVLNGVGLPGSGDERFRTPEFEVAIERIFDVRAFLRWASLNVLLGAWDNYYATPANYYLYNSGKKGGEDQFMAEPYFHWIPWDYDHSFGIDYFDTAWQYMDLIDWEENTRRYYGGTDTARLPLVKNLLLNETYLRYYLDHIEHLLDTSFNETWLLAQIGTEGGDGLWEHIRHAAYLESDSPTGAPHTGRQFTNDQVYWNGFEAYELDWGWMRTEGLVHYVRMRHDSARAQLATLRAEHPRGASGASFPASPAALPDMP